jgi:hypothetical protein
MSKQLIFTKAVTTSVEPARAIRTAEECLLEVRLAESSKAGAVWLYEYEVRGESGRIEKFIGRLHKLGTVTRIYNES